MAATEPTTSEKAQEIAGQAQEKAEEAVGQAKTNLRSQVDNRSTEAGERIATQASDIRTVSEELRKQGKEAPAKMAEQAADRAEKLGSYLKESDADRILGDVEEYARTNPWAVAAGGLALGFVASRFLKASSTDRYRGTAAPATGIPQATSLGNGNGQGRFTRDPETTPAVGLQQPPSTGGL